MASSLETIRTVRIRGETDGVDSATAALNRLTASIQAANDNLAKANTSAKANSDGWKITGEGAISAANHLRQAAEAAYVFSPAFREVTNSLAAPALKGAATALEAIAEGIVAATNIAGTGVIRLGTAVETTFPALALLGTNLKTAGAWMEAFSPSLAGVATTILSRLLPALSLLGKGLLIVDAIRLVSEAWRLGGEALANYVSIAEKARDANVSTDFFQRISKAAEDAKHPVDELADAFKRLNQASAPTLGGTTAQNRLDELTKIGNFSGNSGVGDLKNANSNEERLRALASFYDQALEKGQRLAALDIVKAFGGDQLETNLAKDSGYLDKMIEAADEIAAKDLISAGDIQRATELRDRLDAAEKILSQRWHPIQDLLTQLGIKMREVWVDIVEAIAKAVDAVFKLGEQIANALSPVASFLQTAAGVLAKAAPMVGVTLGPIGSLIGGGAALAGNALSSGEGIDPQEAQRNALLADGRKRLAEAMSRHFDVSKAPVDDVRGAYDRATESVLKYIEVTKASAQTVGLSVAEQEKAKVIAQLTAAAMKDGTPITAALRDEMARLGDQAAAAAQALEKAKIASDIKFNRATALLSQEDVQIAQTLKGLYGSDIPAALNSAEAAQIRYSNTLREIGQLGQEVNRSLFLDFETNIRNGATAWDAFQKAGLNALGKIADKLTQMATDQLWSSAFGGSGSGGGLLSLLGIGGYSGAVNANGSIAGAVGATSVGGAPLVGLHSGGIVGSEATFTRYVHPAYFDNAPRFHSGGIAGDEVPIIARKGEGVFTQGQMAALGQGAGSQAVQVSVGVSVDDDGKIQAYVKNVSQSTTAQGIQAFADSQTFVGRVAAANKLAQTRRLTR
jgi:hypothetical protein